MELMRVKHLIASMSFYLNLIMMRINLRNILRKNLKGLESVLKKDKGLLVIAGLFIWGRVNRG
ncbi:hypothetical protein AWG58_11420 [Escherichia coli]|nr:hypothetical protein AWG58_11420 [Escherichia coli]